MRRSWAPWFARRTADKLYFNRQHVIVRRQRALLAIIDLANRRTEYSSMSDLITRMKMCAQEGL